MIVTPPQAWVGGNHRGSHPTLSVPLAITAGVLFIVKDAPFGALPDEE
jgi:hypothetical protein